jgi:hypothetical protein
MRRIVGAALVALFAAASPASAQRSNVPGLTTRAFAEAFVQRDGAHLTVAGRPFRFAGANVEWLGLRNYGPAPGADTPRGSTRYPTRYEIDDALRTLHEMGATVVRAQTLGDTTGCARCLEPRLGHFNPRASRTWTSSSPRPAASASS